MTDGLGKVDSLDLKQIMRDGKVNDELQLFKNMLKQNCTFVAKSDFATLTLWNDEEYGFKDLKFSIKNVFLVKDR